MQNAGMFLASAPFYRTKPLLKDIILPTKSNHILHVEIVVSTSLSTNTQTHRPTLFSPLAHSTLARPPPLLSCFLRFLVPASFTRAQSYFAPLLTVSYGLGGDYPFRFWCFLALVYRGQLWTYTNSFLYTCSFPSESLHGQCLTLRSAVRFGCPHFCSKAQVCESAVSVRSSGTLR